MAGSSALGFASCHVSDNCRALCHTSSVLLSSGVAATRGRSKKRMPGTCCCPPEPSMEVRGDAARGGSKPYRRCLSRDKWNGIQRTNAMPSRRAQNCMRMPCYQKPPHSHTNARCHKQAVPAQPAPGCEALPADCVCCAVTMQVLQVLQSAAWCRTCRKTGR